MSSAAVPAAGPADPSAAPGARADGGGSTTRSWRWLPTRVDGGGAAAAPVPPAAATAPAVTGNDTATREAARRRREDAARAADIESGDTLLAGALAGLVSETLMHPFDTVSLRAKVHPSSAYGNLSGAFRLIFKQGASGWGASRQRRGSKGVCDGAPSAVPARSLIFASSPLPLPVPRPAACLQRACAGTLRACRRRCGRPSPPTPCTLPRTRRSRTRSTPPRVSSSRSSR
jgi:hypothetical protein